jgi:hypothetical protein
LGGEYWPPLMLGRMLFSRGGAYVSGGRDHVRKEIAEASTMYWAYRRRCRPAADQSHGWGSGSQWGTRIRRDYRMGDTLIYNADGNHDLAAAMVEGDDGLCHGELVELVTHRCFITADKPHGGLYPYRYRFSAAGFGNAHSLSDG